MEKLIELKKADPSFIDEVKKTPGGENIALCYACGTCTASCPVRAIDEQFNPRRVIHMARLGLKDIVLQSDFVWLCAGCVSCQERCPQGVTITDLMTALRNLAVENGYVHPSFVAQASEIYKHGFLYEVEDLAKKREKMNLPVIHEKPEQIDEILKSDGVDKIFEEENQ